MNPLDRLDSARVLLEDGRPDRALARLRAPFPAELRPEAELVRAEAERAQGRFTAALAAYRRALRGADRGAAAEIWLGILKCERSLGNARAARAAWARARAAGADRTTLALESAMILRAESRHRPALRAMLPLLSRARREGDRSAEGFLLWAIAGSRRFSGDLAGSHRDFRSSRAAFRRAGDAEGEAYALFGLGGIARVRGLFREAEAAYLEAKRRLGTGPDLFGRAYAHCGLANVQRQLGALGAAERNYAAAYRLYAGLGDLIDLGFVDWGQGQVHQRRGELAAAERRYRAALRAFSGGGEERGLVLARKSLAEVLHARGRTAEGQRLFDAAVALARRAGLTAHLEPYT